MNHISSSSDPNPVNPDSAGDTPILIVPYMWIGDFVRCLSVVKVLKERWPHRPVDVLTTTLCAPLLDYAPGVRQGIVQDLPRKRLPLRTYISLARRLRAEHYGTALIMLRTWKSALAPFLAGIPERVGFAGEMRFVLLNDVRWGEKRLERMIDRCGVLALPEDATPPREWPLPELAVPAAEIAAWKDKNQFSRETGPAVALAPGAVGRGKKWPTPAYAELAKVLADDGIRTWILGGPGEKAMAQEIIAEAGPAARDLTGHDLRNAILAIGAADAVVSNDSGLMHVAAAVGTPTIGIFGPTSPRLWAPLNPVAAILEPPPGIRCPTCGARGCADIRHRRTDDVSVTRVHEALLGVLSPHLDAAF